MQALLALAGTPAGARGGSPVSDEPLKVSLFSLGNMCVHKPCSRVLQSMGLVDLLRRLSTLSDPQIQKHVARIQVRNEGGILMAVKVTCSASTGLQSRLSTRQWAAGKAQDGQMRCAKDGHSGAASSRMEPVSVLVCLASFVAI